jgi:RimJ/RimL family protein N-acetyltransferase
VTLRAIDPARDAADYHEWNQEPDITRWVGNIAPATVAESQQELERLAALPDKTQWAIVNNADGRMIGRFFVALEDREGALVAGEGNRMAKPYWRRGHNRDARRLVFEYVFGTLKADVYETHCWRDNVNSRQSILAHGFRPVGERPELNPKCGEMWVRCFFQMTRREWEERARHEKGESGETR